MMILHSQKQANLNPSWVGQLASPIVDEPNDNAMAWIAKMLQILQKCQKCQVSTLSLDYDFDNPQECENEMKVFRRCVHIAWICYESFAQRSKI